MLTTSYRNFTKSNLDNEASMGEKSVFHKRHCKTAALLCVLVLISKAAYAQSGTQQFFAPSEADVIVTKITGTQRPSSTAPRQSYTEFWHTKINKAGTTSSSCRGKRYEEGSRTLQINLVSEDSNYFVGTDTWENCGKSGSYSIAGRYNETHMYYYSSESRGSITELEVGADFLILRGGHTLRAGSDGRLFRKETPKTDGRAYYTSYFQHDSSDARASLTAKLDSASTQTEHDWYSALDTIMKGVAEGATQVAQELEAQRRYSENSYSNGGVGSSSSPSPGTNSSSQGMAGDGENARTPSYDKSYYYVSCSGEKYFEQDVITVYVLSSVMPFPLADGKNSMTNPDRSSVANQFKSRVVRQYQEEFDTKIRCKVSALAVTYREWDNKILSQVEERRSMELQTIGQQRDSIAYQL